MICGLHKRIPLRLNHAIGLILLLPLLSIVAGACAARHYPEPGTPYENRAIGYEFSFEQTDDSVEIDLRNISDDVLDVGTIGFYAIDGGGIRPIDALAIGERQLASQATTHITFPKEGEGFIIMNSTGSFVTGEMFEVRYQRERGYP